MKKAGNCSRCLPRCRDSFCKPACGHKCKFVRDCWCYDSGRSSARPCRLYHRSASVSTRSAAQSQYHLQCLCTTGLSLPERPRSAPGAEHRQLTVMFCVLTSLAAPSMVVMRQVTARRAYGACDGRMCDHRCAHAGSIPGGCSTPSSRSSGPASLFGQTKRSHGVADAAPGTLQEPGARGGRRQVALGGAGGCLPQ